MTSIEHAAARLPEIERIRAAIAGVGLSPERFQAVTEHVAGLAEGRGLTLREKMRAARERNEARPKRRMPKGIGVLVRTLGTAWAALMLSTLIVAIVSRPKAIRESADLLPEADDIHIRTALGPMAFTSKATAFRGGTVDCWYGGGFVDLRAATLSPDGAVLRVRAVFGGGQIVVPETWRVTSRVRGIGGIGDSRPAVERAEDAPHLTIEGIVVFGGFAVQSTIDADEVAELEQAVAKLAGGTQHAVEAAVATA